MKKLAYPAGPTRDEIKVKAAHGELLGAAAALAEAEAGSAGADINAARERGLAAVRAYGTAAVALDAPPTWEFQRGTPRK